MMKNFTLIVFLIFYFIVSINIGYTSELDSNHTFPISIGDKEIPNSKENIISNKSDKGLSSGAVTAITLGSIFGGLGAIIGGVCWYKKYNALGFTLNKIYGEKSPIISLCLENKSVKMMCDKYKDYTLLKEIFDVVEIKECPKAKYIIIPDSEVQNKYYDIYFFEIPKDMKYVKIVQNSKYDGVRFRFYSGKNQDVEMKRIDQKILKNKIIQYFGIHSFSDYGTFVVEYESKTLNTKTQNYAYLIEFLR